MEILIRKGRESRLWDRTEDLAFQRCDPDEIWRENILSIERVYIVIFKRPVRRG
jgi:hypothetical protein